MPFLLDTTALSEPGKPRPNAGYMAWAGAQNVDDTFVAAPSIGELFQGLYSVQPSATRDSLARWIENVVASLDERVIELDAVSARAWGIAAGKARVRGKQLDVVDAQIASIAVVNKLTLVTRNVRDFDIPEFDGLKVLNPWT